MIGFRFPRVTRSTCVRFDAEAVARDAADAHQESAGARAPGEARGFGIEEGPFFRSGIGDGAGGDRGEKIARKLAQCADIRAAVALVRGIQRFFFEMRAESGFDFVAGKPVRERAEGARRVTNFSIAAARRLARPVRGDRRAAVPDRSFAFSLLG